MTSIRLFAAALAFAGLLQTACEAAENLRVREGLSFVNDVNQGFPIIAEKKDDVELSTTNPTFLFFGAAGDLNTNRQAKRIVELYKKYKDRNLKFVLIDVDRPGSPAAKALIKAHYQGYIPGEVLFDKSGSKKWSHAGEVEVGVMSAQVDKLLSP